jgi:hypothetical protein
VTGMRSARTPCMPLKVKHSLSERRQPERTLDREAGSHPVDAAQARCCPAVAEVSERAVRTVQSTRAVARAALRSAAPKIDCLPQSHPAAARANPQPWPVRGQVPEARARAHPSHE